MDKFARVWFRQWSGNNLPDPIKTAPQEPRLKNAEALRPFIATQCEAEKETKGWDHLSSTSQRVILAASANNGNSILTSPTSTIHSFLDTINVTALQAYCALTYAGHNIDLPTYFFQALLQVYIRVIPDPDAPT